MTWKAHTTQDGQTVAKCSTCGANAHIGNLHDEIAGEDAPCARCTLDEMAKVERDRMANLVTRRSIQMTTDRKGRVRLTF